MANPVRPLDSVAETMPEPGPGPVAVPPINFPSERPARVAPERRGNPAVNEKAQRLGRAIGSTVEKVRELPQRIADKKERLAIARSRRREDLANTAAELKQMAQQRVVEARHRARHFAYENPLQVIAGAAGLGFIIGFMLRIWRSHARS